MHRWLVGSEGVTFVCKEAGIWLLRLAFAYITRLLELGDE